MLKNPQADLKILNRKEKLLGLLAVVILILTFFYDNALLRRGVGLRFSTLDGFMLFITDFGFLYFIMVLVGYLLINRKFTDFILIFVTTTFAFEISYILKIFFQTPRPYFSLQVATIPLTQASGYSFPSLHTVICFALLPFFFKIFKKKWQIYGSVVIILLIALSRPYLGVHYVSDVVAGALIGYGSAKLCLYLQAKYQLIEWFFFHVRDKFEFRRQVAHLTTGLLIVFLLRLKLLSSFLLLVILTLGGILSLLLREYKIPLIYDILLYFERPNDLRVFPGKGSFFLVMGAWLSTLLFREDVALAAIMIVAIGDSITTIVGKFFGKIKNPLNPEKNLEGTFTAIGLATLGAFFFVDFTSALFASIVALAMESFFPYKVSRYLDDNVIIPLVAGSVMTLL